MYEGRVELAPSWQRSWLKARSIGNSGRIVLASNARLRWGVRDGGEVNTHWFQNRPIGLITPIDGDVQCGDITKVAGNGQIKVDPDFLERNDLQDGDRVLQADLHSGVLVINPYDAIAELVTTLYQNTEHGSSLDNIIQMAERHG